MKKFITAVFCTALALSSGFTAYAAEAPDRESLETAIWEDLWNGKGDNGLEYPEASYKHHLLDKWLDDNYGTGGYDWTDVGEVTHGYRKYYRDLIDGWDFEDDNSGNWTIETEDNFYSFTLLNGQLADDRQKRRYRGHLSTIQYAERRTRRKHRRLSDQR